MTDDLYIWAGPHDIDAARAAELVATWQATAFAWEGRRAMARRQENQG